MSLSRVACSARDGEEPEGSGPAADAERARRRARRAGTRRIRTQLVTPSSSFSCTVAPGSCRACSATADATACETAGSNTLGMM